MVNTFIRSKKYLTWVITRRNDGTVKSVFTEIYKYKYWGSDESVSGPGSTLDHTENLRSNLPKLFEKFSIRSIFDAPCGDFNWMRHFLKECDLKYIGGDVVSRLIKANNSKYRNSKTKFIHLDLINAPFPKCDLMICRDCLFHLSFHDIKSVLKNFIDLEIPYLLTTTHVNCGDFENKDIATGDFRRIDLFSIPYYFSKDVLFRIEDWKSPLPKREMCLWSREQIIQATKKWQDAA